MTTELKPIPTGADYKAALVEVERLWGAKSGTPKGDRLDVLATLIDAYEARHYPMDPPDPIEAIQFRMEQLGLTRKDLEPLIGTRTRRGSHEPKTQPVDRYDPPPASAPRHFRRCPYPPGTQRRSGVTAESSLAASNGYDGGASVQLAPEFPGLSVWKNQSP
jgi:antitoxin component HigA of HigAB toxin-antitoxin module